MKNKYLAIGLFFFALCINNNVKGESSNEMKEMGPPTMVVVPIAQVSKAKDKEMQLMIFRGNDVSQELSKGGPIYSLQTLYLLAVKGIKTRRDDGAILGLAMDLVTRTDPTVLDFRNFMIRYIFLGEPFYVGGLNIGFQDHEMGEELKNYWLDLLFADYKF